MADKEQKQGEKDLRDTFDEAEFFLLDENEPLREVPAFEALPEKDRKLYRKPQNDMGNTARLVERFGKNLSYVDTTGWYAWNKKQWSLENGKRDACLYAEKTVEKIKSEAIAAQAAGPYEDEKPAAFKKRILKFHKFGNSSGNITRVYAMITQAEKHLWDKVDSFDKHPLYFNLENGTLNLDAEDNGAEDFDGITLRRHNRRDKITKKATVKYDKNATCPAWEGFIKSILPDDDVRLFIQRFFGYCLTGSIDEQAILCLWGDGSNGKSTLINIMHEMLGDYALVTPVETLLHSDKKNSGPTPELARLPGARFVSASEPDYGERFSEKTIKLLTGGETMYVRGLFKNPFDFKPQFKIVISFNHKPVIVGQDEGIWRRILLVPFDQRFVDPADLAKYPGALPKDKTLEARLMDEKPGILNWLLDGFRMWKESGLQIPAVVEQATNEYRSESNPVLSFIQDWCERDKGYQVGSTKLYEVYQMWCEDEYGADAITQTSFGKKLSNLGFKRFKKGTFFYRGLKLSEDAEKAYDEKQLAKTRGRYGYDD